ncbi:uncharacterized protein EV420DRAFT_1686256 [Desarmillaria tabescens]|uniref:Uncharacterized protein n=1 Tax=Armillaria tabescens TaxID=1929756 RepID=A0AA39NME0_ARMTA|nr:uncharacterized protein EV420DRAFT_1686256 [Desarmillaria tabescens]KAK0468325.1 hypothetical protein EV420DRAFT_1686256 [Desarmillaria tabescens]
MKPVAFLRNSWKKRERTTSSPSSSEELSTTNARNSSPPKSSFSTFPRSLMKKRSQTHPIPLLKYALPVPSSLRSRHQRPYERNSDETDHQVLEAHKRLPQLDGVWKGFLQDIDEDPLLLEVGSKGAGSHEKKSAQPTPSAVRRNGVMPPTAKSRSTRIIPDAVLDPSTHSLRNRYHITGSTSHLPYVKESLSRSSSEANIRRPSKLIDVNETEPFLSLFPSPPPLRIRKKNLKPLVLLPTPTIIPLPPSPAYSTDTTPTGTPRLSTPPISPRTPAFQHNSDINERTRAYAPMPYNIQSAPTSPMARSFPSPPTSPSMRSFQSPPTSPLARSFQTHPPGIPIDRSALTEQSQLPSHRITSSESIHPSRAIGRSKFPLATTPRKTGGRSSSYSARSAGSPGETVVQWGYAV